jgi:hypothetical protein
VFSVDLDGVEELERDWAEALRAVSDRGIRGGVKRAIDEGVAEAKARHAFKSQSGNLESQIKAILEISTPGGAIGVIASDAHYSSFVEEGTGPHDIWPKEGHGVIGPMRSGQSRRAKTDIGTHRVALRWQSGGRTVFARMVHHPGSMPYPFMGIAYLKAESVLYREIESAIAECERVMSR